MSALYQSGIEGNSVQDQRDNFKTRFASMQKKLDIICNNSDDEALRTNLQTMFSTYTTKAYELLDIQENSATAEQSSASSQELNDHAKELKNMVDKIEV